MGRHVLKSIRLGSLVALLTCVGALTGCQDSPLSSTGCSSSQDCAQGQICSGECVFLCTNDTQCGGGTTCQGGLCLQVAGSTAECADGTIDPGEECDDGNRTDGDGCDSDCSLTACGNGIVTTGEACDDGNEDNTDGCVNVDGVCRVAQCGDGFQQAGVEACDDGNDSNVDACVKLNGTCQDAVCGDGFVQDGVEACDDGNDSNNDACVNDNGVCLVARCGDGFQEEGVEQCDDANLINGDGCDNDCTFSGCGNGTLDPAEECEGSTNLPNAMCVQCEVQCQELFGDCDGDPTNGCEQPLDGSEHCGACGRDCLGDQCLDPALGTCAPTQVASVTTSSSSCPRIELHEDKVFWMDGATALPSNLYSVPKVGGMPSVAFAAIDGFSFAFKDDDVFFVEYEISPTNVLTVSIARGSLTNGTRTNIVPNVSGARRLAVSESHVFWTRTTGSNQTDIYRSDLNGAGVTLVSSLSSLTGIGSVRDIKYQEGSVWIAFSATSPSGAVYRINDPDGPGPLASAWKLSNDPWAVGARGDDVFWTGAGNPTTFGELRYAGIASTGLSSEAVVSGLGSSISYLEIGDDFVYLLSETTDGSLRRYDRQTRVVEELVGDLNSPLALRRDDDYLYWMQRGSVATECLVNRMRIFD